MATPERLYGIALSGKLPGCIGAAKAGWCAPTAAGEGAISHNTWIHRIVRVGVRPLAGTAVRPNHLTTARLAAGLAAAGCFAVGDPAWNWAGAGIFVLAMALDRADGVLARLTGTGSRFGHVYDLIADGASNAAAFIGIGIGVARSGGALAELAPVFGIIAGFASAFAEALLMRLDAVGIQSTAELGGVRGFDPDDAMILVPLAVVAGVGGWMLAAAAVGASAVLVWFTWRAMRAPSAGR